MINELSTVTLTVQPRKSNELPPWLGRATQAFLLEALEQIDPALSAAAHDGSDMKPFTASTLFGKGVNGTGTRIHPQQTLRLRYTSLKPHLSLVLLNRLLPVWYAEGLDIHDQLFSVVDTQNGVVSFAELLERASPTRRSITLEFASPTAFKATAGHMIPLPQPDLVFGSLLDRWLAFSPIPLPTELHALFADTVSIQDLDIRTQDVRFGGGKWARISGFTGRVTYRINTGDSDVRRCVNALAAFARFGGVGVKTTTGMGQVYMR